MMLSKALASAAASAPKVYVEDVFSTWLLTGSNSTQTISNGIDLSGKGGLIWFKGRNSGASHTLADSSVGWNKLRYTTSAGADTTATYVDPLSNGFSWYGGSWGDNAIDIAFWTFRKAAKFFDVVSYVGDGTNARLINHSLGSVPGCIIIKSTSDPGDWSVFHRGYAYNAVYGSTGGRLNTDGAFGSTTNDDTGISPTSATQFEVNHTVGVNFASVNASGSSYVAYLFAHDAGGFGDTGNESVIKCGSFTTNAFGVVSGDGIVDLGWEPQWLLLKSGKNAHRWMLVDNMRGFSRTQQNFLVPNNANTEQANTLADSLFPTVNGFGITASNWFNGNDTYMYIAIRRGPMKKPTDATKVFTAITATASTGTLRTVGFPADMYVAKARNYADSIRFQSRLTGFPNSSTAAPTLYSTSQAVETTFEAPNSYNIWNTTARDGHYNSGGGSVIWYYFRRAPGFFDVVTYEGGGSSKAHSLGVKPELAFIKARTLGNRNWIVATQNGIGGYLNVPDPVNVANLFVDLANATSTTFPVNGNPEVGQAGNSYIAYLFASCPGVSKIGFYTGSSSTVDVDCGFTNGARFILVKRTNSGGFQDWFVFDSARGIASTTDHYIAFNRTDAENFYGGFNAIVPNSTGFSLPGSTAVNDAGGTYLYLAIA